TQSAQRRNLGVQNRQAGSSRAQRNSQNQDLLVSLAPALPVKNFGSVSAVSASLRCIFSSDGGCRPGAGRVVPQGPARPAVAADARSVRGMGVGGDAAADAGGGGGAL